MATWQGDEPGHDVLTHGSEVPPRRGRRLVAGGLVAAALATGYAVTTHGEAGTGNPTGAPAPAVSEPVDSEQARVTVPPTVRQLAGVWLVDEGPETFRPGEMWMSFYTDGSFSLDPNGALLSDEPWVKGRYLLDGRDLTLLVESGGGCRAGDMFIWSVGMLPSGRLETRHRADNGGYCQVRPGTWEARPLEDADMWRVSWRP